MRQLTIRRATVAQLVDAPLQRSRAAGAGFDTCRWQCPQRADFLTSPQVSVNFSVERGLANERPRQEESPKKPKHHEEKDEERSLGRIVAERLPHKLSKPVQHELQRRLEDGWNQFQSGRATNAHAQTEDPKCQLTSSGRPHRLLHGPRMQTDDDFRNGSKADVQIKVRDGWNPGPGVECAKQVVRVSAVKTRIMYIEDKSNGLNGPARIGRVTFSKSGRSLHYAGRTFQTLAGSGFKANYFDVETGDHFWISGPRKDGQDRLYEGSAKPVDIDSDVRDAYWRDIRGLPNP